MPLQVLHHHERLHGAVDEVLAEVVDGADVRVIEGRGRASLAKETFQRMLIPRKLLGKKLEGELAPDTPAQERGDA